MPSDLLTYDFTLMMADSIGEHGATQVELDALMPQLEAVQQEFLYDKDNDILGFVRLHQDAESVLAVQSMAAQLRQEFDTLVVLGIGGSDLGARALHAALNHTYYNLLPNQTHKLYFAGANTDPRELADLLDVLDLSSTVFNVISKSGDTIETMSSFVLVREKLIAAFGLDDAKRHILVSTDAVSGTLRTIVEREGYRSLVVPADVGGRFSVMSSVGLLPAAFSGIQIDELLAGAAEMDEYLVASSTTQNPALMYAALQYLGNVKRGQHLSVLMPYAEGLRGVSMWYRQLWAESLGKEVDLDGKKVYVGPTPIAAVGATDQHSQVQLYNEGPFDKLLTFIRVEEPSRSLTIGTDFTGIEELSYLKGIEFGEIIQLEQQTTAIALAQHGRPSAVIILPRLDETTLGALLYFFEVACAYSGSLYHIDTYNQPGVEGGKQSMYALLGRDAYQDRVEDLQKWLHPESPRLV